MMTWKTRFKFRFLRLLELYFERSSVAGLVPKAWSGAPLVLSLLEGCACAHMWTPQPTTPAPSTTHPGKQQPTGHPVTEGAHTSSMGHPQKSRPREEATEDQDTCSGLFGQGTQGLGCSGSSPQVEVPQALTGVSSWPGTHTQAKVPGVAKRGSILVLLKQGPHLSRSTCTRNCSEPFSFLLPFVFWGCSHVVLRGVECQSRGDSNHLIQPGG